MMQEAKLHPPVAIVTGAAAGIGKAIASTFLESGYSAFLFDRDQERLGELVSIQPAGRTSYYCGDVSKAMDVKAGLEKCIRDFGKADILIANAGIYEKYSFLDIDESQWDRVMAVNLKGIFLWGQAVARWMVENHQPGRIINIACIRSEVATSSMAAYIASKGAVRMLTKAMAVDLAPYGITVNGIEPGRTRTEGTAEFYQDDNRLRTLEKGIPLGRLGTPEDIARTALFLASPSAEYITGALIPVDGGYLAYKE